MYRYPYITKDNWKKPVWWCKCMILFKYILGKKSTKNLKKDALIPKLIQLYFFPFLLMHVVWWHQQHHTREKSYLNWLALSQKCVFFCTSRSILLHLSTIYIYLTGQSTWGVFLQSYLLLYQCYHMEWSSWTDSSHLWIHHAHGFACNFHLQCPYNHCVEQEAYEDTYQFGSFGYGCFRPTHYCLACTMVSEWRSTVL